MFNVNICRTFEVGLMIVRVKTIHWMQNYKAVNEKYKLYSVVDTPMGTFRKATPAVWTLAFWF